MNPGALLKRFAPILKLLKDTFLKWQDDNASWLAAALAYYTLFSLAPLVIIIIAVAGLVFGQDAVQGEIQAQASQLIGPRAARFISVVIESASTPSSGIVATTVGSIVLLFGATNVFAHLQGTLNTIWDVRSEVHWVKSILLERLISMVMIFAIGFLILLSFIADAVLAGFGHYLARWLPNPIDILGLQVANTLVFFGIVTFLFALLYKTIPKTEVAWNDVWIGATVTAFLFTIGKLLLGIYIGRSQIISAYGATGSILVVLFWFYYSAQILFFGAEFTYLYARRFGSKRKRHAKQQSGD